MRNLEIILFSISILLILYSCNENLTTTEPPLISISDTVDIYDWDCVYVSGNHLFLGNGYVADSNNMWIEMTQGAYYFDGKNITTIDLGFPQFRIGKVDGYDKNNVFFGGALEVSSVYPFFHPIIKKLSNGSFTTFEIDSLGNNISDLCVTGPDQVWISPTEYHKVYYFDNGNITAYELDTSISRGNFHKDDFGNLYYFGFAYDYQGSIQDFIYSYKFNGSDFSLLSIDSIDFNYGLTDYLISCGDDMVMGSRGIYNFDGMYWQYHSDITSNNLYPLKIGGISKDSLFTLTSPTGDFCYFFNSKWYVEKNSPEFLPPSGELDYGKVHIVDGKIYCTYYSYSNSESFLLIGKPKYAFTLPERVK